ncbi:MAG: hypothetical protein WCS21_10720 [Lachnospiraceae bacterium]
MSSSNTFNSIQAAETKVPHKDGRDRLRSELADTLLKRIKNDAFFAADFFGLVAGLGNADTDPQEALKAYRLLPLVFGDREADVKRIVGTETKEIFTFIREVISSTNAVDDSGDSLKK